MTLTGEIQARFNADLSFRVSGPVRARLVDVGAHVNAATSWPSSIRSSSRPILTPRPLA